MVRLDRREGALSSRALFGTTVLYLAMAATAAPALAQPGEDHWTVEKIVTVPDVLEVAIDPSGTRALSIVRTADLALNKRRSTLLTVDVATGATLPILVSDWIQAIRAIPGSRDFSFLADRGRGVQLYRLDTNGTVTPIVTAARTVVIGNTPQGISVSQIDGPVRFGVIAYGFAPDGRSLWYSTAKTGEAPVMRYNDDARALVAPSEIELHLVGPDKSDVLVTSIEGGPLISSFFADGSVTWSPDSKYLRYVAGAGGRYDYHPQGSYEKPVTGGAARQRSVTALVTPDNESGPQGGTVKTEGWGAGRRLVERRAMGIVKDYGHADFIVGGAYTAGRWRSPDGAVSVLGIRHVDDNTRSGLIKLTKTEAREIPSTGGFTACDFTPDLAVGVCVQQSMTHSPELVCIDVAKARTSRLADLAPSHSSMPPLRTEPRRWKNRMGYVATGFVVYPRGYDPDRRYPAIVVTHGNDGDARFVSQDLQWEFPVQVWAERGYAVAIVNLPPVSQAEELDAAWKHWVGGKEGIVPTRLQDLIWFNSVASFEAAVEGLAAEGLVDPKKVGIAGYSFGSQMVNVTMTQSKMFAAGSSGDGGYLEPTGYLFSAGMRNQYRQLFGGSPYDPKAIDNYRRLSPSWNAAKLSGPILQQITKTYTDSKYEFFVALRELGMPAELVLLPGEDRSSSESHLPHIPKVRIAAMNQNLDWFDYWLLGKEDLEPTKATQYARWRKMRTAWLDQIERKGQ